MNKDYAKTWIEIDSKSYEHNIKTIKSLLLPEVTFCSVLKANAYGHGIELMAKLGLQNSINCFAVDSADEAIAVRKIAPNAELFILGFIPEPRLRDAILINAVVTVYDEQTIVKIANEANILQKTCNVNVKCETGTQRQGIALRDFKHLLAQIEKTHGLVKLCSLASHFSSSEDIKQQQITINQNNLFDTFIDECKRFGFNPKYNHISCSASTIMYPQTHRTLVRIGMAQYGLWPSPELKELFTKTHPTFQLKPILSWKSRVAQVKDIQSGTPVGYDQRFVSDRPMRIAIIPIGYYDGFVRANSNKGSVIVHGQRCQVIGNVCMNMIIINVSSVPRVNVGDEVIIIGRDSIHSISAQDHAKISDTIHYEALTRIGNHIPRISI